jgi:hypothetical protein
MYLIKYLQNLTYHNGNKIEDTNMRIYSKAE